MATFLDLGLLQYFGVFFPVVLIFAVVYSVLQKSELISKSHQINGAIGMSVALLALLSPKAIELITFIAPWFVLLFFFLLLVLVAFSMLGLKEKEHFPNLVTDPAVYWTLIGISVLIIGAGFANVFGQDLLQERFDDTGDVGFDGSTTSGSSFDENIVNIIFHPRIIGFGALMVIAVFSLTLLTNSPKPK